VFIVDTVEIIYLFFAVVSSVWVLVVSTSASDCRERLVSFGSEMTCYVSSGPLNSTADATYSNR